MLKDSPHSEPAGNPTDSNKPGTALDGKRELVLLGDHSAKIEGPRAGKTDKELSGTWPSTKCASAI